jgi:hypothetical protein
MDEPYPLISWQRYGNGKTALIATDQLWRMRFKRGDQYHARFWGQMIQFLTLSRLLGGNRRIHLETDRNLYRQGETVTVTANVVDEAYEPIKAASYTLEIRPRDTAARPIELTLEPIPGLPGMFQGYFTPERPGRFEVVDPRADDNTANRALFEVEESTLEQREPAMQENLLRKMAELSGGRYFRISDLPDLPEAVGGEARTVTVRRDKELWDQAFVFAVILLLAGAEWFLRRRFDLI